MYMVANYNVWWFNVGLLILCPCILRVPRTGHTASIGNPRLCAWCVGNLDLDIAMIARIAPVAIMVTVHHDIPAKPGKMPGIAFCGSCTSPGVRWRTPDKMPLIHHRAGYLEHGFHGEILDILIPRHQLRCPVVIAIPFIPAWNGHDIGIMLLLESGSIQPELAPLAHIPCLQDRGTKAAIIGQRDLLWPHGDRRTNVHIPEVNREDRAICACALAYDTA